MQKFQEQITSYAEETIKDIPPNTNPIHSRQEQTNINDHRQLYNQYTTLNKTSYDLDPSFMSITPTVVQVKRPDVYSYFYYE